MKYHDIHFVPSGRRTIAQDGSSILKAAEAAGEPILAECGGRGACGRCMVNVLEGEVPDYRVLHQGKEGANVLACLTPIQSFMRVQPVLSTRLPRLVSRQKQVGQSPLHAWAPWPLPLDPLVPQEGAEDLGVALDLGTTTLRLLLLRLSDGVIVGESGAYNPQIKRGADVISRIVAAEKGGLEELSSSVRSAVLTLLTEAKGKCSLNAIRGYVVAGNTTMMHLLTGTDPSGIRQVPSQPRFLSRAPLDAQKLGWPGHPRAKVHLVPASGGWVGGDIVAGVVRAQFSRAPEGISLYVDLGTNGEIALGNRDFMMACACSAGPSFEGGGICCGMRADRGAIDGAKVVSQTKLEMSVIGGGKPKGICGSGLIVLADALFRAGWIDKKARFTEKLPEEYRHSGPMGAAVSLSADRNIALWERDLASLMRSKAAIFAGIRTLVGALGEESLALDRVVVSGNFGRFLNLPAALGIGLLPRVSMERYQIVDNGSLEGAALALLSKPFMTEITNYVNRITYIDLSDCPNYMDEFVSASFLPHTTEAALRW